MATAKKAAKAAKAAKSAGKSKANGKAPNNAKWKGVALPSGYNAIQTGDFGQRWDFEARPVIEGSVVDAPRDVEQGTGKNKRITRVIDVKEKDGTTTAIWESAALQGFFDSVKKGSQVSIAFRGYRPTGKGKNPMKDFVAGIKGGTKAKAAKSARR